VGSWAQMILNGKTECTQVSEDMVRIDIIIVSERNQYAPTLRHNE